jgi:hypothetical protein
MHNYDFGSSGGAHQGSHGGEESGASRRSMFSLIVMIVVVAVLAIGALGIAFWAVGFLFHIAGWILRVAVLAAVAAFVWRWVNRRWSRDRV